MIAIFNWFNDRIPRKRLAVFVSLSTKPFFAWHKKLRYACIVRDTSSKKTVCLSVTKERERKTIYHSSEPPIRACILSFLPYFIPNFPYFNFFLKQLKIRFPVLVDFPIIDFTNPFLCRNMHSVAEDIVTIICHLRKSKNKSTIKSIKQFIVCFIFLRVFIHCRWSFVAYSERNTACSFG